MAAPGSILITDDVMRLTKGYIDVKALGLVPLKGIRTPIEIFEVIGAGPVHSRVQAAVARGLTRFVGRDAEMEMLRRALAQAASGRGQIVAVLGEAGVGKSRILYEFVHSSDTRDWFVLELSAVSYRRAAPYASMLDLVKTYFKIDVRDDLRTIREKVTGKLLLFDQSLQDAIPPILYLLEALPADHPFHGLEPLERREHAVQAIKRIVLGESRLRPVVVVFEDLQWTDTSTLGVLDGLIEALRESRVLLLVSYRPEHQHDWGSRPYYRQIRLDPLPRAGVEELLHALLGADPDLAALKGS